MAVKNTLQAAPAEKQVTFQANGQPVTLSLSTVKKYLISGGANVTDQEAIMFINLCKYQKLNPWLREAYCIKYGSSPATLVTGKEAFLKRAEAQPNYDGSKAGVVVLTQDGEITYRDGALVLPNETLVGGWAEVFRKDKSHSMRMEVSMQEYTGKTKDGRTNEQWTKRPATMIRKVALVQALRESFPENLGALYVAEEVGGVEQEAAAMQEMVPVQEAEVIQPEPAEVVPQEPEYSTSLL